MPAEEALVARKNPRLPHFLRAAPRPALAASLLASHAELERGDAVASSW
jgi:hypothetical protein